MYLKRILVFGEKYGRIVGFYCIFEGFLTDMTCYERVENVIMYNYIYFSEES